MNRLVVAGIDLAGAARRATGVCLLRIFDATTALLYEDEEILDFVRRGRPDLVWSAGSFSKAVGRCWGISIREPFSCPGTKPFHR